MTVHDMPVSSLRRLVSLATGLGLLAWAIAGCGLIPRHVPRASDQWSNGALLGTAILNNQVALQVDRAGNCAIVWVGLAHKLHFARLDRQGEIVDQRSLELRSDAAQKPRLLMDSAGQLHLTWLESHGEEKGLCYAQINDRGHVVIPPVRLTGPGDKVGHSRAVLNEPAGRIEVFWSDSVSSTPGVYHLALDLQGKIVAPSSLIVPQGLKPDAQMDGDGFVHLVWSQGTTTKEKKIFYAVYDPAGHFMSEWTEIASFVVAPGQVLHGPIAGIDKENGYIFWAIESRARESMVSHAFHTTFSLGQLERRTVAEIQAPDQDAPQFDPDRGRFNYYYTPPHEGGSGMVPLSVADTDFLASPSATGGQQAELAVAFNARVYARNTDALQIAVLTFREGRLVNSQIVNDSQAASLQPNVATDANHNLHLVWIDTAGFNRYQVVYASTSPQVKATLNRMTIYDVVNKVLSMAMSAVSALFFIPLVLGWMLVPMGWLLISTLSTSASEVSDRRGQIALGVAMLLHVGGKQLFFPSLLARFSFAPLLPSSAGLFLGRWILPLLLAALSAVVMWAYLKRARSPSILIAYLIYAAVDALLTLVIYVGLATG